MAQAGGQPAAGAVEVDWESPYISDRIVVSERSTFVSRRRRHPIKSGRAAGRPEWPRSRPHGDAVVGVPPTASVVPLRGKARQRHRRSLDTRKPGVKALGLPAGLSGSVTKASWSAWVRIGKLVVSGCGEGKRLPSMGGWWAAMSRYRLPEPAPANRCPSTSDAFTVGAAGVTRQSRISIPRPPGIACLNQRNRALAGPSPGLKCVLPRPEQSRFVRLVLYEK